MNISAGPCFCGGFLLWSSFPYIYKAGAMNTQTCVGDSFIDAPAYAFTNQQKAFIVCIRLKFYSAGNRYG